MTASHMSDAIGGIDSRFVEEALDEPAAQRTPLRTVFIRSAAAAACVLLVVGALWRLLPADRAPLSDPAVTVTHLPITSHPRYPFDNVYNSSNISASLSITQLEEFDSPIAYFLSHTEDDVFSGMVTGIDTLELDFDGERRYVLLAHIQLRRVYRGGHKSGDEVTVWLANTLCDEADEKPFMACPVEIGKGVLLTTVGTDASHTLLVNGISFVLSDVADYVYDDEHFCFTGEDNT